MEDRYLFKAKHTHILPGNYHLNGSWIVGFLSGEHYIANDSGEYLIDPSTICQCTGLKDKNGKLIWENDIVKYLFSDACAQIKYGSYQSCFDSAKTEHVGFYVDWPGKYTKRYRKDLGYWINMVNAEVIGNIFDNKELLESEEK